MTAAFAKGAVLVTNVESERRRDSDAHESDVIIVPKGTPHWVKDVSGPVLYYLVNVQ